MGVGSASKRRRTPSETTAQNSTPSRAKPPTGRSRGRPPNVPRDGRERPPSLVECFKSRCDEILDRLIKKDHYDIFLEPVNTDVVSGYLDVIKNPMDFTTIRNKLQQQQYRSLGEFRKDLDQIWSNCLLFNGKEPTNIFSKKAIELRRLTEKLIASTRHQLEKDKESLNQWKEKHRRKKDSTTLAAPPNNPDNLDPATSRIVPQSSIKGFPPKSPSTPGPRDMDGVTVEFETEEDVGRTPQQVALAEALRLQYAGSSGLYKRSHINNPVPQYTKPDGSVVEIPIARYNPKEEHWDQETGPSSESRHQSLLPTLLCDSLPPPPCSNPCGPRADVDAIFVGDYVASLLQYSKPIGPVATKISTEILSPELTVKIYQDQWRNQGLNLLELAKQAETLRSQPLRPEYTPRYNWTADEIMHLADNIERSNRKGLSIFPKLLRTVPDYDGIDGLRRFLDPTLVKEVEEVPTQVIDFSMPHGVQIDSLEDILQLKSCDTLRLSLKEKESLDKLKKSADDFLARQSLEKRSQLLKNTPRLNQLHQEQVKAFASKRQRRFDAERHAAVMSQCLANAGHSIQEQHFAKRKREAEIVANASHSQRSSERRSGQYQATRSAVARRVATASESASAVTTQLQNRHGNFPLENQLTQRHSQDDSNRNNFVQAAQNAPSPAPLCIRCGIKESPSWHTLPNNLGTICLSCGIEWQNMQRNRQKEAVPQPLAKRPRGSIDSLQNGSAVQMQGTMLGASQTTQPLMNDIAGRTREGAETPSGVGIPGSVTSPNQQSPPNPSISTPNGVTTRSMHRNSRNSPSGQREHVSTSISLVASNSFQNEVSETPTLPAAIGGSISTAPLSAQKIHNFHHIQGERIPQNTSGIPKFSEGQNSRAYGTLANLDADPLSVVSHPITSSPNDTLLHQSFLANRTGVTPSSFSRDSSGNVLTNGLNTDGYRGHVVNTSISDIRPTVLLPSNCPQSQYLSPRQTGNIQDAGTFRQSFQGNVNKHGVLLPHSPPIAGLRNATSNNQVSTELRATSQTNTLLFNTVTKEGPNFCPNATSKLSMEPNLTASIHQQSVPTQYNMIHPGDQTSNSKGLPHSGPASQSQQRTILNANLGRQISPVQPANPLSLATMNKRNSLHMVGPAAVSPSLSKLTVAGNLPFPEDGPPKNASMGAILDGGVTTNTSQRYMTQSFENGEMIGDFHGNDTMFGNADPSNGIVGETGNNVNSEIFFDDNDLAPATSAAAPELDF